MAAQRRTIRRRHQEPAQEVEPAVTAPPAPAPADSPSPKPDPGPRLDPGDLQALADMDPGELAALLEGSTGRRSRVQAGERVEGSVTRIGRDSVFVDVGGKSEGLLDRAELPDARPGDAVTAFVLSADEQGIQLSLRLSGPAAAEFLEEARETGAPVEGRVVGRNPGGFDVRIGAVRAFCPISLIARLPEPDPDAWIGRTLEFKVIETEGDVVLSRRALLEERLDESREAFWQKVAPGDRLQGVVTSVQPFGVFVDVEGVDGLVPKRELAWEELDEPTGRFARGQALQVRVIEVDVEAGKLTLSARDPSLSPWTGLAAQLPTGTVLSGKVVRTATFGAFIEIRPGVQGLLHISRGGRGLKPGAEVEVQILGVDTERERVELGLPGAAAEAAQGPEIVQGRVEQVLRNGLLVALEDGRTGWVPAREVALPAGTVLAQRFRPGKELTARVTSDDPVRRRVELSLTLEPEIPDDAWRGTGGDGGSFGTMAELLQGWKAPRG